MTGGFSFCGVDVSTIGLEYAPENANTYVYAPTTSSIQEESFDGHDGGYFYGSTKKPKDFILRCFYEATHIQHGIMTKIHDLFRIGKTGKLVFQKNPWCYYVATVVGVDTSHITNYLNGLVTIKMRAYYPFSRSDETYIDASDENAVTLHNNTGLFYDAAKNTETSLAKDTPISSQKTFLLYNAGTEKASVAIEIAGDAPGVTIANSTTGQKCKLVGLTKAKTSDINKYIVCDGLNGKTVLSDGTSSTLAFRHHDSGFIELEPGYPITRNVKVFYEAGSNVVTSTAEFDESFVGKYIWIDGSWKKILSVSDNNSTLCSDSTCGNGTFCGISDGIIISSACQNTGNEVTEIVTMNEIIVTPDSTMNLTKLNFVYKPTFS